MVILLGLASRAAEKRRTRELAAYAAEHGWTFAAKDDRDRPGWLRGFRPFGQGHARTASNIFQATRDGLEVEVFDYRYTVKSGKSSHTYTFTVAVARTPIAAPQLTIRPETLADKVFDALGGEDIDVEDDSFSRRYWVRGLDRRFAYDVLHAPMQEFLMAQPDRVWQWEGDRLLVFETGRLDPSRLGRLVALLLGFRAALPRHLLRDEVRTHAA